MGEIIAITSGKGGTGKTVAAANISFGLASLGKRVIVLDMNFGMRNLDIAMGMENNIIYHLLDAIEDKCTVEEASITDKRFEHLFLLPAPQTKDASSVTPLQVCDFTSKLKENYDFVILDCPSGMDVGFYNAVTCADRAIVMTSTDVSSIRNTDCVIRKLEKLSSKMRIDILLNRVRFDLMKTGDLMTMEDVEELLTAPIIGLLPEEDAIRIGSNKGEAIISKEDASSQAFTNICKRILGEEIPYWHPKEETKGIFSRFRKQFKQKSV